MMNGEVCMSIGLSKKLTLSVIVRRLLLDNRLAGRMYVGIVAELVLGLCLVVS